MPEAQAAATQSRPPSRTAFIVAAHRAAHQKLEGGRIFADPFAHIILGKEAIAPDSEAEAETSQRPVRLFIAARSRFAEDCLSAAVSRGVRQAIILGAGLDTFSLRNPHVQLGLHVFEVDHPATQAWKRERLMQEGLTLPTSLTFAPVDFERQDLADGLRAVGFQSDQPAFFHWLGCCTLPNPRCDIGNVGHHRWYAKCGGRVRLCRAPGELSAGKPCQTSRTRRARGCDWGAVDQPFRSD